MTKRLGARLYRILFASGWPRRALLIFAAAVFVAAAWFLTGGTDYRTDPAALVPRSVQSYIETSDLDALLRSAGAWRLWRTERRSSPGDQYNRLQVDIAERIGRHMEGLGARPLRWLVGAGRAAYADGGESWALILHVPDLTEALSELSVDPGMLLETLEGSREQGIFKLTRAKKGESGEGGTGGGELVFATLAPWLIISSAETLPRFAVEAVKEPAYSLANSGILPGWNRGASLRGMMTPADSLSPYSAVAEWMAPEMRVNFISSFRNGLSTVFDTAVLTERVRTGGLWSLVKILLFVVALACVCLVFAIILVMFGWGGWLKIRAARMGIAPLPEPEDAPLSDAFREDAGLETREEVSPIAPEGGGAEQDAKTKIAEKNENSEAIEQTTFDSDETTENAVSESPVERDKTE